MGLPDASICSRWAEAGTLTGDCADMDEDEQGEWLQIASDVLFDLSGRQFPGICSDVFRPTGGCAGRERLRSTRSGGPCCAEVSQVDLGVYPVVAITDVTEDGATLDVTGYRVDDYRYLVRLPDADGTRRRWRCCQRLDLPDTEDRTWSVTVSYGRMPPPAGVRAARVLACELATSADPDADCRLPERVTSVTRQGVSAVILDPFDFLDGGKTGIYEVDLFLRSVNPHGLTRPPSVLTPASIAGRARRVGT